METLKGNFLEPERIIKNFGLEKGDHVADFGAGHGYFAIPMARAVGGDGKVYALEIQKSALDMIRARGKLENIHNIEPMWIDLDHPGAGLKSQFLEFVLMANILYQAENKPKFFEEAYKTLRKGGRMAVIEWDEIPTPLPPARAGLPAQTGGAQASLGPALNIRVRKDTARRFAQIVGFEFDREFDAGSHHYGLLFKKQ